MNNSQGALYFGAGIDTAQFRRDIETMRRDILGLNNTVKNETKQMDSSFKNLSIGIAGYFSASALIGFTQELINVRGEFQKTEIAFSTMLGDGGKATELMSQMVDLAAKTPFSLSEVANGAKQLLAFQIPADQVVDTLTRMGNIAAGLSVPLARINLVYGQVKAKGKLMGDDLRQFTEAGIPMVAELAKKFGKTTGEITAMVSAGKIGFKDVQDVLFGLTNEGGMFYNLMEKQSKSLSGQIANLGDSWDQMLNKIGQSNEGLLSSGIEGLSYLVEHYEDVIKILTILVSTYGAYRAALILTSVIQKSIAFAEQYTAAMRLAQGISGMTRAQILFNIASSANPWGAIAAIIGLVVSSYILYGDELKKILGITKELTSAQKAQQAVNEEFASKFSKSMAQQKSDIQSLIGVIRNEAATIKQREEAYKKLIDISPAFEGTLDKQYKATQKLGEAFGFISKQIEAYARAQSQVSVKNDQLKEYTEKSFLAGTYKTQVEDLTKERNALIAKREEYRKTGKGTAELTEKIKDLYYQIEPLAEKWQEANNAAKSSATIYNGTSKQINKVVGELQKGNAVLEAQLRGGKIDGVAFGEDVRKKLQIQLDSNNKRLNLLIGVEPTPDTLSTTSVEGWAEKIQAQIDEITAKMPKAKTEGEYRRLEAEKKRLEDILNPPKAKKDNKQIAEFLPLESIKELQQRAQLIQEAMDVAVNSQVKLRKLDKYGKDKDKNGNPFLTGEVISSQQAFDQIQAINDKIKEKQIKSFDEQTAELERRIKVRDQIIKSGYSKEVADQMFPDLAGKDLLKSLQALQADLNQTMSSGKGTKVTADNYSKITATIDALLGKQSALDKFNADTDIALSKIRTEADKLLYLKDLQSELSDGDVSNGFYASLQERIRNSVKQQQDAYQNLLIEHQSFEEKRNEIADKASKERIKILEDETLTPEKKAELTKSVTKEQKEQTSASALEEFQKSDTWLALYDNIDKLTVYQIDKLLKELESKAPQLTKLMTPTDFNSIVSSFKSIKNKISEANPFLGLVNSFRELTKEMGEGAEEASDTAISKFNKVADSAGGIFKNLSKAVDDLDEFRGFLSDSANDALGSIQEFAQGGIQVVKTTGDAVNGISSAVSNALDNASWSNWITAIIQIIYLAIKAIVSLVSWLGKIGDKRKEKQIKRWADEVQNLKDQYDALKESIDRALGEDVYKNQTQMIANLREQQRLLNEMRDKENDKKKTDDGKVDDYNSQINEINNQINDIYDNISQSISQTNAKDLASTLADALIEAYGKGADAAEAYGKVADDVMKNAVKNALKMQLLEGPMQNIIKQLIKNMGFNADGTGSFDGLTEDERAQIKSMIGTASNNYIQALGAYSDLFGEAAGNAKSLEGAVKGITEDTASLLAGQMNAIRIMQGEALKVHQDSNIVLKNSLLQLTQIEINTRYLKSIFSILNSQNSGGAVRAAGLV